MLEGERPAAGAPELGGAAPGSGMSSLLITARGGGAACKGASNGLTPLVAAGAGPDGNGTITLPGLGEIDAMPCDGLADAGTREWAAWRWVVLAALYL